MRRRPVHEEVGNPHRLQPLKQERESRPGKSHIALERFGKAIAIINDNGSGEHEGSEDYLPKEGIRQYGTRPKSSKENPFVERLIGTLQRECLDYHYEPMNVKELSEVVDSWLDTSHFYRPHEFLNFLTPVEYCATLGLSIPHAASVL